MTERQQVLRMYPRSTPLPCFKCGKELDWGDEGFNMNRGASGQPWGGVMCSTSGNYGSLVFDSISRREMLYFNICDQCLLKNRDRLIWMRTIVQQPTYEYLMSDPFEGTSPVELSADDE